MAAMAAVAENTEEKRDPWVTTGDARAMLGVSHRVLKMLIRRGALLQKPNIYDRRIMQIARADVERVLHDGVDGMKLPNAHRPAAKPNTDGETTAC